MVRPFFAPATMDRMRLRDERAMDTTCAIVRAGSADDGAGGTTTTWDTVATVACRIRPTGSTEQERVIASQLREIVLYTVAVPLGTDVTLADRLTVDSLTLGVVAVIEGQSYATHLDIVTRVTD